MNILSYYYSDVVIPDIRNKISNIFELKTVNEIIVNNLTNVKEYIIENISMLGDDKNNDVLVKTFSGVIIVLLTYICLLIHKNKFIYNYYNYYLKKDTFINDTNTSNNTGLYKESVNEIDNNNSKILKNIYKNKKYIALIRVQLLNDLQMDATKFKLNSNSIKTDENGKFTTRDMYMIYTFHYKKDSNDIDTLSNKNIVSTGIINVMNFMNAIMNNKFITNDFVVVALCEYNDNYNYRNEFYKALETINYEITNIKNVKYKKGEYIYGFTLLLPIHQIYDIFMDVFNYCIFKTRKYIMEDNNEETWNGAKLQMKLHTLKQN